MAENESQSQTNVKGGGSKKIIVAAVVVVAVAGIAAAAYFGLNKPEEEQPLKETISAENVDEKVEEIFEKEPSTAPAYYTVTQTPRWTFPDGKSESNDVYVENVTDNETPVYFDLIVDETNEKVYSSPVLELGAKLESFKLDTPLEKGEYQCTVEYHMVDEDQNELTTVNVGVTVVVEN
jgi:hypothetical protein